MIPGLVPEVGSISNSAFNLARLAEQSRCLQEVTYLTSPGALNPLPAKPLLNLASVLEGQEHTGEAADIPPRPKKALPEETPESTFGQKLETPGDEASPVPQPEASPDAKVTQPEACSKSEAESESLPPLETQSDDKPEHINGAAESSTPAEIDASDERQVLTAIYKPESKAAWREELRAANEVAEKVCTHPHSLRANDDRLNQSAASLPPRLTQLAMLSLRG